MPVDVTLPFVPWVTAVMVKELLLPSVSLSKASIVMGIFFVVVSAYLPQLGEYLSPYHSPTWQLSLDRDRCILFGHHLYRYWLPVSDILHRNDKIPPPFHLGGVDGSFLGFSTAGKKALGI